MNATPFLNWLETTVLARFIQVSAWAFPAIETVHVIAISIVVGTVIIIDLRLLGIASIRQPMRDISREITPWTWGAFGLAVASGSLMFLSNAPGYFANGPFRLKMILLLAAGTNMLAFRLGTYRGVGAWNVAREAPVAGRVAAALSLVFWLAIVAFGRWIGFTIVPIPV